jgi:hypothetical protein
LILVIPAYGCGGSGSGERDGGAGSAGTTGSAGTIGVTGTAGASGTAGAGGPGAAGSDAGGSSAAGAGGAAGSSAGGRGGASGSSAGGAGGTAAAGTGGGAGGGQGGTSGNGGSNAPDGGPDGRPPSRDAGPYHPLGMNDVTILAPLPPSGATVVLLRGTDLADDGTAFVPSALFERVTRPVEISSPILRPEALGRLHLIAVRFDLCDRQLPGACPETEDARMRLVFQPMFTDGLAQDAGFHAFYAIRNDEIDGAVAALRELAALAPPQTGMLRVSPALTAANPEAYAAKVRAFVKRYGGETRLIRLTVNAQPEIFAQVRWELRGVEKKAGAFVDIPIFGSTAISESIVSAGNIGFDVTPIADTPAGLRAAITRPMFDAADATKKRELLAALVAVENPMTHTAETAPCVGCHVSTPIVAARAQAISLDPLTLPGRYTSSFDLSTAAGKSAETQVTRALGYLGRNLMISQRVVNETAQTLTEIEQRYPAP